MVDGSNNTKTGQATMSNAMAAFSSQLNHLVQSIDVLYIKNNAGGRRIFRDKWPEVAEYLFGIELTKFDTEGVNSDEDRRRRSELEDEADMRRIDLKKTMSEFIDKSVDAGSLQFEYVGSVIDKYGASLSKFLYEEGIIERVRPGALEKASAAREAAQAQADTFVQEQSPSQDVPVEQKQDITGTQKIAEQGLNEERLQQNELAGASEELVQQSLNPQIESIETDKALPQEKDKEEESARLSVEEVELLSNKLDEQQAVQEPFFEESGDDLPASEEDPFEHVKPIETSAPDEYAVIEQQQMQAAEEVRELLEDEEQILVAPELLNLQEAMAAQNIPALEDLLEQGILLEEQLPQHMRSEQKGKHVSESAATERLAGDQESEKKEGASILSLEEEVLREDLSQALKGLPKDERSATKVTPDREV